MADTHYYTKGELDGEVVFFGGFTTNDAGALSDRKQKITTKAAGGETVWVTNTKGKDMTCCLGIETARFLVNREGRKFRFAVEEEIPYVPKEKVLPYDNAKNIQAQEQSNVEMSARDVKELVDQGIDPLEGVVSYKELRQIAKDNGISSYKLKKKELTKLLRDKGLIE